MARRIVLRSLPLAIPVPGTGYDWLMVGYADRVITWGETGVPGGTAQYRDGGANARSLGVSVLDYGADPTGVNDCTAAFNNARTACPANRYIYIPNGTYRIAGTVNLTGDRTWRGQSVTGTIIRMTGSGHFATGAEWPPPTYSANGVAVTAGATKGRRVLTVANTAPFTVGQLAQLTDLTKSYMHANSTNSWSAQSWVGYDATRLASIMFTVEAIDAGAHTITLDHALPLDMNTSPLLMPRAMYTKGIGFENLQFDCSNHTNDRIIGIYNSTGCWVYGCYFKNLYTRSVWFSEVTNCSYEHSHADHGQNLGRNCEGLDFNENCCWCRVEDSTFHSAGYPMVLFSDWMGGCVGNAVLYNFQNGFNQGYDLSTMPISMDDSHGPHTMFNLWEGNVMEVFGSDGYYGSSSHGMMFRNRIHGTCSEMAYADQCCFELNHWSSQYSIIGNILGTPQGSPWNNTGLYSQIYEASGGSAQAPHIYRLGYPDMGNRGYDGIGSNPSDPDFFDTNVAASLLRHGNYDYVNLATMWDPTIVARDIPASMAYLAKPSYFGARQWPPIGPDVSGYATHTPASARWAAYAASGNLADLF